MTFRARITNPRDSVVVSITRAFTVTISACVVTSYTGNTYSPITYTIGTTAAPTNYPYPTFVMVPACTGYTATKDIEVNNAAFPGTNMNGGGSMSSKFTDTGT